MVQRNRTFFAAACTVAAIIASFGPTSLHAQTEYPWSEISFLSGCWSGRQIMTSAIITNGSFRNGTGYKFKRLQRDHRGFMR